MTDEPTPLDTRVYLQYGTDDDADAELVERTALPDDAYQAALAVDGAHIDGTPGVLYDVWIVEQSDADWG